MKLKISNLSSFRIEFSKNSLNCAALRCVALRCAALHCVALRCATKKEGGKRRKDTYMHVVVLFVESGFYV